MTDEEIRRRPGGREPVDLGKLNAAFTTWQAQDEARHTMRELARRAGTSVQHVQGILSGKHGVREKILRALTIELGVPYASVLADEPAAPRV